MTRFLLRQGEQNSSDPIGIHANGIYFLEFLNGVFCIWVLRPFDKIDMTLDQGQ